MEAQNDNGRETALAQMIKSVEKLGSSTKGYGDKTLTRFLIARSMDPEKAAKMFVEWRKWRSSMVPNGFIPDSEVPDELGAKKVYLQGLSKHGFPVVIGKVCNHFPAKDRPQFKKFVVHMLDKSVASVFKGKEIGDEKLIAVLDLQGITYKNVDARGLITGFQFLQSYYPERLEKCFLLDMPSFFVAVWKVVCRFLEKRTQEKIVIVSNEDERKAFINEVGEDVLPVEYGGKAQLRAIQDVTLPPLELEGCAPH